MYCDISLLVNEISRKPTTYHKLNVKLPHIGYINPTQDNGQMPYIRLNRENLNLSRIPNSLGWGSDCIDRCTIATQCDPKKK